MRDLIIKGVPTAVAVCALILSFNWFYAEPDTRAKLDAIQARYEAEKNAMPHVQRARRADKRAQKDILLARMIESGSISVMEAKVLSKQMDKEIEENL